MIPDWETNSTILDKLERFDERSAWREVDSCFRAPIVRFGQRAGLRTEEAEDVAQEALMSFATAYRGGRYRRGEGKLSSWLFGIARNHILQAQRKARRPDEGAQAEPVVEELADERVHRQWWEEEWMHALYDRCLRLVRSEMHEQSFEIFKRCTVEGVPAPQVAEELGVSVSQVYNAKSRGLKRLQSLVDLADDM